ncbi:MAG: hypothetical protein LBH97_02505 [Treponema sp.]|jgi:hypothetical protein|nr:hypothetical protein [Treponema sp.]
MIKLGNAVKTWNFQGFTKGGLIVSLVLCGLFFLLYVIGNIPDPGFPDNLMFWLLRLLNYSSVSLCVFSLCALGICVRQVVESPRVRNFLFMALYFLTGIMSAVLAILSSLIIATTGGNQ